MKLTSTVIEKVAEAIREGHAIRFACIKGGISETSYFRWRSEGKKILDRINTDENAKCETTLEEAQLKFYEATELAHAEYVASLQSMLKDVFPKTWQAICWTLERRYPKEFGRFGQPLGELKQDNLDDDTPPEQPEIQDDMESIRERLRNQHGLPKA